MEVSLAPNRIAEVRKILGIEWFSSLEICTLFLPQV
jgi:hypothetical protein